MQIDRYETDVLVIGSGGAGLRAALEAGKTGVKVLVVSKGKAGQSGCTIWCTGNYAAAFEEFGDHPDTHFQDSLRVGEGLNDEELLKLLVSNSPKRIMDLHALGARLFEKNGRPAPYGAYVMGGGHSLNRSFKGKPDTHIGIEIISCLFRAAKATGVKFIDGVYIINLILCENEVAGCIGFSMEGQLLTIIAKTTILATGGGCAIFSRTDNPQEMVGDGHAMGWQAGGEMVNMEFVMFHPTIPVKPRASFLMIPTFVYLLRDGAVLRNKEGKDILKKYTEADFKFVSRDLAARWEAIEMRAGAGMDMGVYLDATGLSSDFLEKKYSRLVQIFLKRGVDIRKEPFIVGPGAHSFLGGLRINSFCETNVPRLYAAGEVTGGIHGAHELPGNHLAETQVFGAIAGEQAALRAMRIDKPPQFDILVSEYIKEIKKMEGTPSLELTELTRDLKQILWKMAGILRTEVSLEKAMETIENLKSMLPSIKVNDKKELTKLVSLKSMLDVAALLVTSALWRKESRGCHYREDYPQRDDESFRGNIILKKKENGAIGVNFGPHTQKLLRQG